MVRARARTCAQRIDQYGLDKVVRHGRIWRLTLRRHGARTDAPHMLNETPAQLVAHLTDPNGWWRDTAQQLLVLKQDKSVVPALKQTGAHVDEPARAGFTRCGRSKGSARPTRRSCAS